MTEPIAWTPDGCRFLDQTQLPDSEAYVVTRDYRVIAEAIRSLKIRGAPLIGISAAYGVALAAASASTSIQEAHSALRELLSTRPTAVNLRWALQKMESIVRSNESQTDLPTLLLEAARSIHHADAETCQLIARHGLSLFSSPQAVLTHCNTGSLATGGIGTAQGIITTAFAAGMVRTVFVDETRPLFQGARLTAWELMKAGVPCTLITDGSAAFLMQKKMIDCVIVGADRIASNGDTANKIGTYSLAVCARAHGIALYVAAPTSTIDVQCSSGREIPIEERSPDEVLESRGTRIAPAGMAAFAPAFDLTPGEFISAIITEKGVFRSPYNFNALSALGR